MPIDGHHDAAHLRGMNRYDFRGKTVLVTGASMGIGEAFARAFHARGARLVLVARSEARLRALAEALGPDSLVVPVDLEREGAAEAVRAATDAAGLEIDVLVNNAGFGAHGAFGERSLEEQRGQIDLNVRALVALTQLYLPSIVARRGGVLNVASTAAFQPVPYMAVYAATKAFVLSFFEALCAELRGRGVRVVALCPGATDTPFFARAGQGAALGAKASSADVVRLSLEAFDANRPSVIHGASSALTAWTQRVLPRAWVARLVERLMRPQPAQLPG
jgi:short-subunit dehydrogenase